MKIFFHLILVFLLASNSIAQNDSKLYKQSFGFDVDIPRVLTNHVFNSKMYGVGEVGATYDFLILKNIGIGIKYKYSFFQLNSKSFQQDINGQFDSHFAGLSLIYVHSFGESSYLKSGIHFGLSQLLVNASTLNKVNYLDLSQTVAPEIGFYITKESFGSVGLILNYNIVDYVFDLQDLNQNNILVSETPFLDRISWFGVGFKYEHLINN